MVDIELGGSTVPAGSVLLISPWALQRDSRWFDEPLRFRPERWTAGAPRGHPFTYIPFGGGTRACIGQSMARISASFLLAVVARRWRLEPLDDAEVEVTSPLVRPSKGLRMRARARS
jgi:cytochrome P450